MINIPKGTKDVLPYDSYKWQFIEKTARDVAKSFGAKEIRTPTFEHTEVFLRGVGQTTDIVNKEMYTFLDKGNRSITLKPEGTAGVARSFVENGMHSGVLPAKLFYLTQCFRYERPQAGRLREFHQFGVEFLGATNPNIDAETILLAKTFLDKVGIKNVTLYLNSIGCKECRAKYKKVLSEYLRSNIDSMCELCKDRLEKNPLRILDCKNENCKKINEKAPVILDYLCDDCKEHFESVQNLLTLAGVEYKINVDGNSFLLDEKKYNLLTYINEKESITEAAKLCKISYRTALNYIDKIESTLDIAIVSTKKGGSGGGGSTILTEEGQLILKECKKINAIIELHKETNELEAEIVDIGSEKKDMTLKIKDLELTIPLNKNYSIGDKILALISYDNISITLKPHKSSVYKALNPQNSSVRNVLEGTVTELKLNEETVRVRITVSGVDIYADISLSALKDLKLELGKEVFISFKALSIATLKL